MENWKMIAYEMLDRLEVEQFEAFMLMLAEHEQREALSDAQRDDAACDSLPF